LKIGVSEAASIEAVPIDITVVWQQELCKDSEVLIGAIFAKSVGQPVDGRHGERTNMEIRCRRIGFWR
jgi:hypothetical protein